MSLAPPIVRSDRHRLHEPGGEVWIGVRTPGNVRGLPSRRPRARALELPTVLVQEGRHDLTTIGAPAAETLAGVQEGMSRA